jgi:hypothetical protein
MDKMTAPTLYLMSKYTGREADSLRENQDAWLALKSKGYFPYSPICETHNIEEYRKLSHFRCPCCKQEISEDGFKSGYGGCLCATWIKDQRRFYIDLSDIDEKCKDNTHIAEPIYKKPDYVARDLRLIENWMKHDVYYYTDACECQVFPDGSFPCGAASEHGCQVRGYDSGVVGVVLPSAVDSIKYYNAQDLPSTAYHQPLSKEVIQEYIFCKSKQILCISLETALTVPPDHWKKMSL